jgi:Zn-dependent protease
MGNYAPVNQISEILMYIVLYTITINIGLGIFNLIPLPPLDGEKIFRGILPYKAIEWLDRNSNILQIIFMILWITGLLGNIVSPIVSTISKFLFKFVGSIFALF